MALEGKMLDDSGCTAGTDLTAHQFAAVKITGPRQIGLASTGGEGITGILYNAPAAGSPAMVVFFGYPKVIAGTGGFTAGDQLVTEAGTAKLVTYASSGTVVAIAVDTVAAGVFGRVKLLVTA